MRLTFGAVDVYRTLEPLLVDYRRLRRRTRDGGCRVVWVDGFVDELLTKDRVCGTALRKLPSRQVLEDLEQLDVRVSVLGEEVDGIDDSGEDEGGVNGRGDEDESDDSG